MIENSTLQSQEDGNGQKAGSAFDNAEKMRGRPFQPGHPGGPGRPAGSQNRDTTKKRLIDEQGFDALLFLTAIALDECHNTRVRVDAAKAVLDRTHPKLTSTHVAASGGMTAEDRVAHFSREEED